MATSTGTLNTNSDGAVAAPLALTTETVLTLYVIEKTGDHNNHRVGFEYSPDGGTSWHQSPHSLNGHGTFMTETVAATNVRACVCYPEGSDSTVDVVIIAR